MAALEDADKKEDALQDEPCDERGGQEGDDVDDDDTAASVGSDVVKTTTPPRKRGRPPKTAVKDAAKKPRKATAKTAPEPAKKAGKKGTEDYVDPDSEVLLKLFCFSESTTRLEVTASTATRKRLCLLSFKITDKHRKTLPSFVKRLKTMLESGKATKDKVIACRTKWLANL